MTKKKNPKEEQLKQSYVDDKDATMTTNEGVPIHEDNFTLKAGERGPSLMQDFRFQEKLMHFDRERIPERVVHARGTAAHGVFTCTKNMSKYTAASFLSKKGKETPVFLRISTVQGSKGSADTVRDPHGFAVKFYTDEGNFDIPGLTHPVFFIQDAIKFPDIIHAVKPEPKNEVPQGQSAHNNFWDFVANNPETLHNVFWTMSDRAIPRSYRMVDGFGLHTYKFVTEDEEVFFVKFHFKPELGVHSLVWDEAQKLQGRDPDFHRKDLEEAIQKGDYPRWTFGVQIIPEKDEFMFDFDILDPTKLWPEELVPVTECGTLELNRTVENFFAENEQAAFHPGNLVRGIEASNDPLLQGRMFSYTDTQMYRLNGPNFQDLPINRPLVDVHNNQRDGSHQHRIHTSRTNYTNNSLTDNAPKECPFHSGGYKEVEAALEGFVTKARPEKFLDFYTQPRMFYNSLTEPEQQHMKDAIKFELTKCDEVSVRQQVINLLDRVDSDIAKEIGDYLGLKVQKGGNEKNKDNHEAIGTGDGERKDYDYKGKSVEKSKALSQENTPKKPNTLKVGVMILDNYDKDEVIPVLKEMEDAGMYLELVSNHLGDMDMGKKDKMMIAESFTTTDAVLYDALYVAGVKNLEPELMGRLKGFIDDTYTHFKPLILASDFHDLLEKERHDEPGILLGDKEGKYKDDVVELVTQMRFWDRDQSK
ncbi:MAG: catalase [Tissierellia bacterium]|nr:catalase [Tissierellia bacterium]